MCLSLPSLQFFLRRCVLSLRAESSPLFLTRERDCSRSFSARRGDRREQLEKKTRREDAMLVAPSPAAAPSAREASHRASSQGGGGDRRRSLQAPGSRVRKLEEREESEWRGANCSTSSSSSLKQTVASMLLPLLLLFSHALTPNQTKLTRCFLSGSSRAQRRRQGEGPGAQEAVRRVFFRFFSLKLE